MSAGENSADLKQQLKAKDEEISNLKASFDEYFESSKELESELERALEDSESRNRALSLKKAKADSSVAELTSKLGEQAKSMNRMQEVLTKTQNEVTLLTQQRRHLEHLHEESEEKLRQSEHSLADVRENLEEAEEAFALLQCEIEELRADKIASENRLKAELTTLQADLAQMDDRSGYERSEPSEDLTTLTADLAEKTRTVQTLEQRCSQLEKALDAGGNQAQEQEIKTLRTNLALVQTELAQVQTDASQMATMQQKSIASFKSTVFAEQEELNRTVLELTALNKSLKEQQKLLQREVGEKESVIIALRRQQSSSEETKEGDIMIPDPASVSSLAELCALSNSCCQALRQVSKDYQQQFNSQGDTEDNLVDIYNSPHSEAAKFSVKLSELTDQFEVLSFKHQSLQLALEAERRSSKEAPPPGQSSELAARQAEVSRLSALVADLKEEYTAKVVETTRSNDTLRAELAALQQKHDQLSGVVEEHTREREVLAMENKSLRSEVTSLKPRSREMEAAEEKVRALEANVEALEAKVKALEAEKDSLQATCKDNDALAAKLHTVEGEKEALRKKISDFVALGDMREVGWQAEREELTKSIQRMTQDINFLRQNEKRLSQDALVVNAVKRVSLEDKVAHSEGPNGTVVPLPDPLEGIIDTTSRSRLAAQRAISSGDMDSMREELLHQVYRFEQLREHNAKLLQKVQQRSNNIQVCCRLRPPSEQELGQGADICLDVVDDTEITLFEKRMGMWKSFEFDKVWDEDATQVDVFADVEPLALTAVDGYNACIFAYGMTGSGKTYTMSGYGSDYGVSYRIVHKIFELLTMKRTAIEKGMELRQELAKNSDRRTRHGRKMCASPIDSTTQPDDGSASLGVESSVYSIKSTEEPTFTKGVTYTKQSFQFSVTVSMLEIYNETVKDLLNTDPRVQPTGGMDIRHDGEGNINVPGLVSEDVFSLEDVMNVLKRGSANRATASTNINEHSSRSHSILMINVTTVVNGGVPVVGKLCLVDLAGSERVERSGAQGRQLKEAQHINRSLSALGDVLEALENKSKHIPYRNSKLTYLLQDSLGGNSRTMMIVTVCPTELTTDETLFCLQFASRARKIQMDTSKRNVSWKTIEESLKHVKSELKEEKKKQQISNDTIKELKRELKQSKEKMSSQLGFKLKNSDESRKSGEQQIQVLTRTNAELMLRLQEEKEQLKNVYYDMENNQKALRRVQEQLKHCKAERDRILATQGYKEQENHNLREMVRLYEDNEEDYFHPQQENHQHNISSSSRRMRASTGSKPKPPAELSRSHSHIDRERERSRHSSGHALASSFSGGGESMQRQPSPGRRGRLGDTDRDHHHSVSYEADGKHTEKRRSGGGRNMSAGGITRAQEALEKHQERMRKKRKEKEREAIF